MIRIVFLVQIILCKNLIESYFKESLEPKEIRSASSYENYKKNPTDAEIAEFIFYESFVSLDSLLFIVEINGLDREATIDFVQKTVLVAKNYILAQIDKQSISDILRGFSTFNGTISTTNKSLQAAFSFRNKFFEEDSSQIAKTLFLTDRERMLLNIPKEMKMKIDKNFRERIDKKYITMISTLHAVLKENGNLVQSINRERKEFMKEFKEKKPITKEEILDLKICVNLGGSIFSPNILLSMLAEITIPSKNEYIEQKINVLLKPVLEMEFYTRHKTNVERKDEVLKFLKACLEGSDWIYKTLLDDAFHVRTSIMEFYLKNDRQEKILQKEKALDILQEKIIINLIERIDNLDEENFANFLIISPEIIKDYVTFLQERQEKAERILVEKFAKK